MLEYQHTVLVRGQYRLVALTHGEVYDPGEVFGYAVVTASGAKLTADLSLDDARTWIDALESDATGGRDRSPTPDNSHRGLRR